MTSVICDMTWSSNVFHMSQKTWIIRHNNDGSLHPHNLAPKAHVLWAGEGGKKQQVWSAVKSTWGKQQLPPRRALTVHLPNVQLGLPT